MTLMLHALTDIIFWTVFSYCALSVGYLFLLSFWGRFLARRPQLPAARTHRRIALLVPAYKEDGIILSTATYLSSLDYPADRFEVFIIADSFQPETIEALRQLPVTVLEVAFEKSTKTRALNEAFRRIPLDYDIALICDADNVLGRDFLHRINAAFEAGAGAVQGCRVAKNLDTPFAILDACSEAINNHIFRKGGNAIGLSSSVIGSGMAFPFGLLKQALSEFQAVGGFDKVLQLKVVEQGISIRYLENALIFDEKVDSPQAFRQQRKRWVSSQFIYLKKFFRPALRQLLRGNFSYFMLALGNNLIVPRAFLLLLLPLLVIAGLLLEDSRAIAAAGLLGLYALTLGMALPRHLVNRRLGQALLRLPRAIALMLGSLVGIRRANENFIHTVHTKTEVTNVLYQEKAG